MKTQATPPPRYRNARVYHSAERLLATPPSRPSRRLPSRKLVFFLGLACGLSIFLWWRVAREEPSLFRIDGGTTAPWQPQTSRSSLHPPQDQSPTSPASSPVPLTTTAPLSTDTALAEQARLSARPANTPTSFPTALEPGAPFLAPEAGALASSAVLRLVGELQGPQRNRVTRVEFLLHLLPGTNRAIGTMKLLANPAPPPAPVGGRWDLNSIVLGGGGYGFSLRFPTTSSGAFDGVWTSGDNGRGTLTLQIPLPSAGRISPQ